MNTDSSQAWSTMIQDADTEFSDLFPELNIDFPAFEPDAHTQHDVSQGPSPDNASAGGLEAGMGSASGSIMGQEHGMMAGPMDIHFGGVNGGKDMMDLEHQARLQQQQHFHAQQQQGHFLRQGVPPTPNSFEMQGGHPQFTGVNPHQSRAYYEAYARKQQEMFTPIGTPAVTPHGTPFNQMPEFATPGEYFSPLTSPALVAQHPSHARPPFAHGHSDTSEAPSPIDMDIDSPATNPMASQSASSKPKRKPGSKPNSRSVRQSPAMKPQRKKQPSSSIIPAREYADILEGFTDSTTQSAGHARSGSGRLQAPSSQTASETGSISPEPLSEVLMPPPATPRTANGRSPNIRPQDGKAPRSVPFKPLDNPATPASLMKLQKDNSNQEVSTGMSNLRMSQTAVASGVGDIAIPHGPSLRSDLQIDTAMFEDEDQVTPTLRARNGSASAPLSALTPAPMSPSVPMSPSGRAGATSGLKSAAKGKKRNSSSHASPALRPKISPSIKPLLPEGAKFGPDTSALLLASKSNYQNILEGTHLPGVSYPEALSENLTSKRTSHKIAEQGRRNRINTALHEIAALLPPEVRSPTIVAKDSASPNAASSSGGVDSKTKGKKERSGSTGGGASASSSKANTVEQAIDYIKSLQKELSEVKGKLAVAEKRLEEKAVSQEVEDGSVITNDTKDETATVEEGKVEADHAVSAEEAK